MLDWFTNLEQKHKILAIIFGLSIVALLIAIIAVSVEKSQVQRSMFMADDDDSSHYDNVVNDPNIRAQPGRMTNAQRFSQPHIPNTLDNHDPGENYLFSGSTGIPETKRNQLLGDLPYWGYLTDGTRADEATTGVWQSGNQQWVGLGSMGNMEFDQDTTSGHPYNHQILKENTKVRGGLVNESAEDFHKVAMTYRQSDDQNLYVGGMIYRPEAVRCSASEKRQGCVQISDRQKFFPMTPDGKCGYVMDGSDSIQPRWYCKDQVNHFNIYNSSGDRITNITDWQNHDNSDQRAHVQL